MLVRVESKTLDTKVDESNARKNELKHVCVNSC